MPGRVSKAYRRGIKDGSSPVFAIRHVCLVRQTLWPFNRLQRSTLSPRYTLLQAGPRQSSCGKDQIGEKGERQNHDSKQTGKSGVFGRSEGYLAWCEMLL